LQAEMLPQPQTRPPLALSVASAAPPRSLLCSIDELATEIQKDTNARTLHRRPVRDDRSIVKLTL
jgi:hypothetical protein